MFSCPSRKKGKLSSWKSRKQRTGHVKGGLGLKAWVLGLKGLAVATLSIPQPHVQLPAQEERKAQAMAEEKKAEDWLCKMV